MKGTHSTKGKLMKNIKTLLIVSLLLGVFLINLAAQQGVEAQMSALIGPIQGYGGQCLDLPYADTADGTNLEMYTCNGSKAQEWVLQNGQLAVKGKCLSIEGNARERAFVEIRSCSNDGDPNWYLTNAGEIRSERHVNLCLDVQYSEVTPKTKVWMYGCNGTRAQQWIFPAPTQTTTGPMQGYGGQCLDLPLADTTNGSNIEMYTCNNSKAQEWTLKNGQLSVKGKCLAIEGDARQGAFVEIQSCEGTRQYAWYLSRDNEIKSSLYPNLCLDVQHLGTTPKTKVWMYSCNQSNAQKWLFPAGVLPPIPNQAEVGLRLHGTTGTERVALFVDGEFVSDTIASTSWRTWTTTISQDADAVQQIEVRFTNDGRYNGVDKNVRVDWISFNGQTYQAEAGDVYSEGAWNRSNGCGPGHKQMEWLHCQNGFFRFYIAGNPVNPVTPIASGDIAFEFDPNVPLLQRTSGQIIAVGDTFNVGQTAGRDFNTPISNSRIESFRMIDGTTIRYGRVSDPVYPDRTVIEYATQWATNDGYQYQPGMHNSTVHPPNDPLFFDGTRVQTSFLGGGETFGLGDTVWQAFSVRLDDGLILSDDEKLYNQWHSPQGTNGLSPMLAWYIDSGQCKVGIRAWSNTNQPSRTNSDKPINEDFDCTTLWEDWIVRVEFYPDSRGQLEVWRRIDGGDWQSLFKRINQPFGANYSGLPDGNDLNKGNYVSHSYYSWHHWGNDHDTDHEVRRIWWAWSGLIRDDQQRYSFDDVAAYLEEHR